MKNLFKKHFGKKQEQTEEPTKKEEIIKFTEQDVTLKVDEFKKDILSKIGNGEYSITTEQTNDGFKINVRIYVTKNEPTYNYLLDIMYWEFLNQFYKSNVVTDLIYDGILDVCNDIAKENGINTTITQWSAKHIRLERGSLYEYALGIVGLISHNVFGFF